MAVQIASLFAMIGADLTGLHKGLGDAKSSIHKSARDIGMALTGIGAAGAAAIGTMTKQAAGFESASAGMAIAARSSGTAFNELHDAALQVGGDTRLVGVTASGAAESITELYKAGLTTTDVFGDLNAYLSEGAELGGVLRASVDLAAASELDMAAGAELVSIAMATFGIAAEDASSITDNFVASADASVASVSELADALMNVGPTAAAFGWGLEDVNTALAILSQRGIKGAEAGTALKSMMTNIMRDVPKVKTALNELNVSLYDESGAMRSLPAIVDNLTTSLGSLSEEQRNQYVQTLAGTYGMKALNTLVDEGAAGWEDMEAKIAGAATAQEIAAAKADTLTGQLEALQGAWETLTITLGTEYLPKATQAVEGAISLVDAFNDLAPATKSAAASFLGIGTVVSSVSGGFLLMLPRIIKTVDALKTLVSTLASLGAVKALGGLTAAMSSIAALATVNIAGGILQLGALQSVLDKMEIPDWVTEGIMTGVGGVTGMGPILRDWDKFQELLNKANKAAAIQALHEGQMMDYAEMAAAAEKAADAIRSMPYGELVTDMDDLDTAAHGAADGIERIGTAFSTVAKSFGDLDVGAEWLWNMATASTENEESLKRLALNLGIASEAEMILSQRAYGLIDAFAAGALSADGLAKGMAEIESGGYTAADAAAYLAGRIDEIPEHKRVLIEQDGADKVIEKAREVKKAIDKIPDFKTIQLSINTDRDKINITGPSKDEEPVGRYQHGTSRVPRTGLAVLHAGEAVLPVAEAAAYRAAITAGVYGGGGTGGGSVWRGDLVIQGAGDPERTMALVIRGLQDRGMLPRIALR